MDENDEVAMLRQEMAALKKEYEEYKQQHANSSKSKNTHSAEFWEALNLKIKRNPDEVRSLLSQQVVSVNDVDPSRGMTVMVSAAEKGSYEIVQLCLNLGADIHHKDNQGRDALWYARDGSFYHLEQLLLFAQMNANAGNQIRDTADTINQQKGIVQNLQQELSKYDDDTQRFVKDTLRSMMESIIESKKAISDDLLNLCLEFECSDDGHGAKNVLSTSLWKCIEATCRDVIQNGNKKDWFWFKTVMLPSTIWFKDISNSNAADNETKSKPSLLYYELLKLVESQSGTELNRLEQNLNALKKQDETEWSELIEWDLPDEYKVVRQDTIPNGITPKYTEKQLYEQSSSSATFSTVKFYDYSEYLPQLVLLAHIVDDEFQKSVQKIFNIDKQTKTANLNQQQQQHVDDEKATGDGLIAYSRGPVKLMERARAKSENDYSQQPFPTSACVLDLNRCSLVFNDIATMLKALKLFVNKVKYYQSGCIIGIVRDKNGWKEYVQQTQYADIKLNVLIKGKTNCIIGEVQFLLNTMKRYKDKAHNLYSVQRQQEYFDHSVTQILPLLLDEHRQLFRAGNMGDSKALCKLMLFGNKTEVDLMQIDGKSEESILHSSCYMRHDKLPLLRFLGSVVPQKVFVDKLFENNQYNCNPIELAIWSNALLLLQYIFSIKAVKDRYSSDIDAKFRAIYWCFREGGERIIDLVLGPNALSVNRDDMVAVLQHTYVEQDARFGGTNQRGMQYANERILGTIAWFNTAKALQKFVSLIGEEWFAEHVFEPDSTGWTCIAACFRKKKIEMIKYIVSLEKIKQDRDYLCCVVKTTYNYYDATLCETVLSSLELDEASLKELQSHNQAITDEMIEKLTNKV